MENKSHALIAGMFTILLGIALALAAVWFNRDSKERVPFELVTRSSIAGLTPQSAVRYRGLEVGRVERIGFDPKVHGQILIGIAVEKGTPLTHSTWATIAYQGVTGLAYIQLDDDGSKPELLASSAAAPARIPIMAGLFDTLTGRGEGIMREVEELARRLNTLVAPENQKILTDTLVSLNAAARDVDQLGTALQPTLARLPGLVVQTEKALVSVGEVGQSFGKAGADFSRLAERLQERGGVIERAAAGIDELAAVAKRAGTSVDLLAATVERVGTTLNSSTLPRVHALVESAAGGTRGVNRLLEKIGDQPQSLIFGSNTIAPGPGEEGYTRPNQ